MSLFVCVFRNLISMCFQVVIDDINIIVEEKMSVCGLVVTGVMASIQFCWLSEASSGRWTGVSRMAVLRGTRILSILRACSQKGNGVGQTILSLYSGCIG